MDATVQVTGPLGPIVAGTNDGTLRVAKPTLGRPRSTSWSRRIEPGPLPARAVVQREWRRPRIPTRGVAAELGVGRAGCLAGAHEIAIGLPPGTPLRGFDESRFYIRDPGGKARKALGRAFSPPGFRRDFRPPADAISGGITNGSATIWTSEKLGDRWLLVQVGDRFERWPRSIGGCGPA